MTKEEKRIELAKIDGWTEIPTPFKVGVHVADWQVFEKDGKRASLVTCSLPNYLESYDAMLRLIQKLPHSRIVHVCDIANPGGSGVRLIQKTPEELGDAVLTAFGKLPPK